MLFPIWKNSPQNQMRLHAPETPSVHTNALLEFTTSNTHPFQHEDMPIQGQKWKPPTNENQDPRQTFTDTPNQPLKS
jgi:hypothetical protein